jgi:hypothetical protein
MLFDTSPVAMSLTAGLSYTHTPTKRTTVQTVGALFIPNNNEQEKYPISLQPSLPENCLM